MNFIYVTFLYLNYYLIFTCFTKNIITQSNFYKQVVNFCHDDQADPANLHNYEAPNEHNRLCSQRSVWDVVTSTKDFDGLKPASISNLEPDFNVVQPYVYDKIVLVLDTSDSMKNDVSSLNIKLYLTNCLY